MLKFSNILNLKIILKYIIFVGYSQISIQKELCILEMQKGTKLTINKLNDLKELKMVKKKKNKIKYSIGEKIMKRREEANEVKKTIPSV